MTSNFKPGKISNPKLLAEMRTFGCAACGSKDQIEVHHIKSVGSGGDDRLENLISLCICHHRLGSTSWHRIGPSEFLRKFPRVWAYLKKMGWEIRDGRLKHPSFDILNE
jgi:hypothetical protein